MSIQGIILLALIFTGYASLLNNKYYIRMEFVPCIISCSISSALLLAGYLNIMPVIFYLIGIGGISSLANTLIDQKNFKIFSVKRDYIIYGIWLSILIYFGFLLDGSIFTHYDNFSHWGAVVKSMLLNDRMPNFRDTIIKFQSYPLGSSIFIYYICKLIGNAEHCYMFAQIILLTSFILPIVSFIKKNNMCYLFLILVFALIALTCNNKINELLVDTLMSLGSVALFAIINYGFISRFTKEGGCRLVLEILPLSIFLINVKNSGIFFYIVCCVYFLWLLKHIEIMPQIKKYILKYFILIDVGISLLSLYLWKSHIGIVFASATKAKHSMSIENYKEIFYQKTNQDLYDIARHIISSIFTEYHSATVMFIISLILLMLPILQNLKSFQIIKKSICRILSVSCIFLIYVLLLFLMYAFSMPKYEALHLAGFDRYLLTSTLFIFGIAIILSLNSLQHTKYKTIEIVTSVIIVFSLFLIKCDFRTLYKKQSFIESNSINKIWKYRNLLGEYKVKSEKKYLIYSNDTINYDYYYLRYYLWSDSVTTTRNLDGTLRNIQDFDYVIIFDPDDNSDEYLRKFGFSEYADSKRIVINVKKLKLTNKDK